MSVCIVIRIINQLIEETAMGILSQEEIDALLNASIGGDSEEPEEPESFIPEPSTSKPEPEPVVHDAPPAFSTNFSQPEVSETPPPIRKSVLRRSPKVDGSIQVQPAVFPHFDSMDEPDDTTNLEVILNLNLEIRVELGKTIKSVQDVLAYGSGSVIELQKLNGEPVDLHVNNKNFARGEMIVIGENFGVRVTDILSIQEIIEALR